MLNKLSLPPSGLIIDAFGELRDQQEQVKEDMEVRPGSKTAAQLFNFTLQVESKSNILSFSSFRPNASSVALGTITLTGRLTGLKPTPYKSTT